MNDGNSNNARPAATGAARADGDPHGAIVEPPGARQTGEKNGARSCCEAEPRLKPRTHFDPRIELVLMHNGRRLGVRYYRFIEGKLALTGFVEEQHVEEPGSSDHDADREGEDDEFREFDPVGFPKAGLERMAQFALRKILENGRK